MKDKLGCIGGMVYLLMGIVQFFAIMQGVEIWFGLTSIFAFLVAIFIAYIPIVGAIAGILGAVEGWGWDYIWAIVLFGWPYIIYIVLLLLVGAGELFRKSE